MINTEYQYFLEWVHLLAWHTFESCRLSNVERKTLGVFIAYMKRLGYISASNSLLANAVQVIDTHSSIKTYDKPDSKEEYSSEERRAINKGIRELHKSAVEGSAVWRFCQNYRFGKTGKRKTKLPSPNKLYHAEMTLAIHAPKNRPLPKQPERAKTFR